MTPSVGPASQDASGGPADAASRHPAAAESGHAVLPRTDWRVVLAVFLSFVASSAARRPVPSVNEPHYLCKAKHYWQPEWCAGDPFLESSNPHRVFYQTVGMLTQWLSLSQTAWAGRLLALGCLAWGWTSLCSRLFESRWHPLLAAWFFLLLQSLGNLSGEWLVGGVESKVFAYAFVFAGLSSALDRRWIACGVWWGMAISFHPIVGLWCVVAGTLAVIGNAVIPRRNATTSEEDAVAERWDSTSWRRVIAGGILMLVVALPGLLPALGMLSGADPAIVAEADRLQVGMRLAHHLDPARFPLAAYYYYALLLILTLLLWRLSRPTRNRRLFARFVAASVLIAVVGALVGWGPRPLEAMPFSTTRIWLLKFYPFRLADLFVPVLLSVAVLAALYESKADRTLSPSRQRLWFALCAAAFLGSLALPSPDRNPSRMSDAKRAEWIAACQWLREESPPDSLLYAANEDWAVKWFAHRPEYVSYKDCPQEAAGIVAWARRLKQMNKWTRESFADGICSTDELARLHADTGITHLIVRRLGPIEDEPAYRNESFRIYVTDKD